MCSELISDHLQWKRKKTVGNFKPDATQENIDLKLVRVRVGTASRLDLTMLMMSNFRHTKVKRGFRYRHLKMVLQ